MDELLTTEIILTISIAGISLLAFLASLICLRAPQPKSREIDIEAAVRDAPYHHLDRLRAKPDERKGAYYDPKTERRHV